MEDKTNINEDFLSTLEKQVRVKEGFEAEQNLTSAVAALLYLIYNKTVGGYKDPDDT